MPTSKQIAAMEMRDVALSVISRFGVPISCKGVNGRVPSVDKDGITIMQMTPFNRPRVVPKVHESYEDAVSWNNMVREFARTPYAIEVWVDGKKVMNVSWGDEAFKVSLFQSGPWEERLRKMQDAA